MCKPLRPQKVPYVRTDRLSTLDYLCRKQHAHHTISLDAYRSSRRVRSADRAAQDEGDAMTRASLASEVLCSLIHGVAMLVFWNISQSYRV